MLRLLEKYQQKQSKNTLMVFTIHSPVKTSGILAKLGQKTAYINFVNERLINLQESHLAFFEKEEKGYTLSHTRLATLYNFHNEFVKKS